MPKVSVIIPVYNAELYLRECLDSVINQTLKDIEIICVDDGSQDNSIEILREYESKDSRIKILCQKNQYAGVARNNGLAIAKGEYIHFLDADDYLLEDCYAKIYKTAKRFDADIIRMRARCFDHNTRETIQNDYFQLTTIKSEDFGRLLVIPKDLNIFTRINVAPWGGMVKRELLERHSIAFPDFKCVNDRAFYWESIIHAKRIVLLDQYVVCYRMNNSSSLIGVRANNFQFHLESYKRTEKKLSTLLYISLDVKKRILDAELSDVAYWMSKYKNNANSLEILKMTEILLYTMNKSYWNNDLSLCDWYRSIMKSRDEIMQNNNMIYFSIIMPVYNAEQYLESTLNSILIQSFSSFEVICIDDGSTDMSLDILKKFESIDGRIRIIQQKNQYAGVARNNGIVHAKGKYIVFLDADDKLAKDALEKFYEKIIETDADVIISNAISFDNKTGEEKELSWCLRTKYVPEKNIFSVNDIPEYIYNLSSGNPWSKCFKRKFILENDIKFLALPRSEDFYFVYLAYILADKITTIDEPLVYYRVNTGTSLEDQKDKYPLAFLEAIEILEGKIKGLGLYEKTKQSYINSSINRITSNLRSVKTGEAFELLFYEVKKIAESKLELSQHSVEYFYNRDETEYINDLLRYDTCTEYLFSKWKNASRKTPKTPSKGGNVTVKTDIKTFIQQKVSGGIQCYKDHGFIYTVKRTLEHLGIPMGIEMEKTEREG